MGVGSEWIATKQGGTISIAAVCWALQALACSSEAVPPPADASAATSVAGTNAAGAPATAGSNAANGGRGATGAAGRAGNSSSPAPQRPDPSDDAGAEGADAAVAPDAAVAVDAAVAPDAAVVGSRSTGPGDWVAGDYPADLTGPMWREISGVPGQGSNVRQYKVHVPPSYDPNVPTPLVFCIHGLGQDALLFCVTGAAMPAQSDDKGFILVMPNGYQNSWNAGSCCGEASTQKLDDVALFRAIFKEVGEHVNIDLDRVYATGLSNGGYMSYRLACDAADMVTAIAPGAGAIGINSIGGGTNTESDFTACEPSRPVSVLHIHGTDDPLIDYALLAPSLELMAMKNGCGTATGPAQQPASAGDTTCTSYSGCPAGVEMTSCTVAMGGHCWFGSEDCGTGGGAIGLAIVGNNSDTLNNTAAVWDFFERTTP
jgi:polyhydroxybutyrate depolymerase